MSTSRQVTINLHGLDFLRPYLLREFGEDIVPEFVSSENASLHLLPPSKFTDKISDSSCALFTANIIGTAMIGSPRELLEDVASGRFFLIRDFTYPEYPAIHAIDVAKAARIAIEKSFESKAFLSDGISHSIDSVARALAFRLDNKQIFSLPKRWALIFGIGRKWRKYSFERLDIKSFEEIFDFKAEDVCQYLQTHVYDESSL